MSSSSIGSKSFSLSIHTLTIGPKQLKTSLLKQMIEEDIVDMENFCLKGVPWGYFNMFFDKSHSLTHYWHIVWQKDEEVRRCVVLKKKDVDNAINHRSTWKERGEKAMESIPSKREDINQSIAEKEELEASIDKYVWDREGKIAYLVERIARLEEEIIDHERERVTSEKQVKAWTRHIDVVLPTYQELVKDFHDLPQFFII